MDVEQVTTEVYPPAPVAQPRAARRTRGRHEALVAAINDRTQWLLGVRHEVNQ